MRIYSVAELEGFLPVPTQAMPITEKREICDGCGGGVASDWEDCPFCGFHLKPKT